MKGVGKWGRGKGKREGKGSQGRWKEDSLRNVGRADARTNAQTLR